MNKIPNRKAFCEALIKAAGKNENLAVLCSDSRGSASLSEFAERFPDKFIEVGIAEQDLVGIAAGMAKCGKKAFAVAPASFLTTRSYEQCKVDVAYSNTNVKLVGISGGISYGNLGMTHHSLQDIAAMSALPNMRVYLPSDRFQTEKLTEALLTDEKPAYIRLGRNPVEDIYSQMDSFELDRANVLRHGKDAVIIACGEMVYPSYVAAQLLHKEGIEAAVLDMWCVKPLDEKTILSVSEGIDLVVIVEEHSPFGGLSAMVSQLLCARCPKKVLSLTLPDTPVVAGKSEEVFDFYGMNAEGIALKIKNTLK